MKVPVIETIYPEDVDLRPMREAPTKNPEDSEDFGYILKTLTQSLHKQPHLKAIPNTIFFPQETQILKSILRQGAQVLVASIKGYPDDLMGYLIYDKRFSDCNVLHWMFVKGSYRRMGLASLLLEAALPETQYPLMITQGKCFSVSNNSSYLSDFERIQQRYPKAIFNPFLWRAL